MSDIISWSLAYRAVKTGITIIDDRKRAKLLKKLLLLVRKKRKIVVFGISGAGKSQFVNSLKKVLLIPQRTLTSEKIKFELDNFPIQFIDTPGHGESIYQRKSELTSILKNGVEGIINVVSYGYEENPIADLTNIIEPNGEINSNYLELNRQSEIRRLSEWLPLIQPNEDINWIITLANKADIWWGDADAINNYYTQGAYAQAFGKIAANKLLN